MSISSGVIWENSWAWYIISSANHTIFILNHKCKIHRHNIKLWAIMHHFCISTTHLTTPTTRVNGAWFPDLLPECLLQRDLHQKALLISFNIFWLKKINFSETQLINVYVSISFWLLFPTSTCEVTTYFKLLNFYYFVHVF